MRMAALALAVLVASCAGSTEPARPDVRFIDDSDGLPTTGQWRQRLAVADLDGDDRPEIIAPPAREEKKPRPHIWSKNEGGRWKEGPHKFPDWPYDYGDVVVADFDGDTRPDLAIANHGQGVVVLLNRGKSSWKLMTEGLPEPGAFPTRALAARDLDDDGTVDIAAIAEATSTEASVTGLRVFWNRDGKRWDGDKVEGAYDSFGDRVTIGNVATGGKLAVVVGSLIHGDRKIVWAPTPDGWYPLTKGIPRDRIFWGASVCGTGEGPEPLFLATDAVRSAGVHGPRVLELETEGFVDRSKGLPRLVVRDVAAGRFDDRQMCDLAALESFSGSVHLFRYSAERVRWTKLTELRRPSAIRGDPYSVLIADTDGDRSSDVVANYASPEGRGGIRVWRRIVRSTEPGERGDR